MQSIRDIHRIGLGPSSSHTMGPKKAAMRALDCATFVMAGYQNAPVLLVLVVAALLASASWSAWVLLINS